MSAILIATIAAIPPTLAAIVALVIGRRNGARIQEVHVIVNSKMTEALNRIVTLEGALGLSPGQDV